MRMRSVRRGEIEEVEQLGECIGGGRSTSLGDLLANLPGSLEGAAAAVEQRLDRDDRLVDERHRLAQWALRQCRKPGNAALEKGLQLASGRRRLASLHDRRMRCRR